MEVLKLSYNHLPPTFKYCFAYCAIYPKDHYFDKDELVRMWVAHGFLESHAKKSLEEVGDECFFYMVDRCFFQEVKEYREEGYLRYTCKMHDLLHDLAIQVAGMESGCFRGGDSGDMAERRTLRHISTTTWNPTFPLDNFASSSHSKTLKTLLFNRDRRFETNSLNSTLGQFRVLRVLQLSDLEFETLPDSFGEMIHLRYLDLSNNTKLKTLPNSICKLYHLQTLILDSCHSLVELPPNLGKLRRLRHLILDGCWNLRYLPSGFEKLTALVTLNRFLVHEHNGGLRYLGCIDDLCGRIILELPVDRWPNCIEDARNANMSRKLKLNGMTIHWRGISTHETTKEEIQAVLQALKPHNNLQYLNIQGYVGDKLSSWVFSLANLKELVLEDCANLEYLEDNVRSDPLFPCLEILKMRALPNLKGWWKEATSLGDNAPILALPRVSKVVIEDCPKLTESMPLFKGIENLSLSKVSGEFVSKFIFNPNMSWSSSEPHHYNKFKQIKLKGIQDFSCLAEDTIEVFTSLETLEIAHCPDLRWVSASGLAYLTSLQRLDISGDAEVDIVDINEGKLVINNDDDIGMPWKVLRRLRYLNVSWHKHLQDGLIYLTVLEELRIKYYRTHQIEADNECVGIMLSNDLKRLEKISIDYCIGDEDTGRCCFPSWVQYLPYLKDLRLSSRKLHMSWSILANMKLERLSIYSVQKVVNDDEIVVEQQSQFNSIDTLSIKSTQDGSWVHGIPWKLFPSLRNIQFDFEYFGGIPDGIQHLTSLHILWMEYCCKGLKAIPNWMSNLTSLKDLTIWGCTSVLGKRCTPQVGEDWPLISHIPRIYIRWRDEGGSGEIDIHPRTLS